MQVQSNCLTKEHILYKAITKNFLDEVYMCDVHQIPPQVLQIAPRMVAQEQQVLCCRHCEHVCSDKCCLTAV